MNEGVIYSIYAVETDFSGQHVDDPSTINYFFDTEIIRGGVDIDHDGYMLVMVFEASQDHCDILKDLRNNTTYMFIEGQLYTAESIYCGDNVFNPYHFRIIYHNITGEGSKS